MATPLILRLDIAGAPIRWIPWQDAVCLYSRKLVAWTTGANMFTFHGGTERRSGQRSSITVHSIIAIRHSTFGYQRQRGIPPLSKDRKSVV